MAKPAFFERAAGLAHLLRGSARPGRPIVAVTASAEALATAACAAFALNAPIFPLDPHLPEPIAKNLLDQIGDCLVIGEGRSVSTEAILAAEPAAAPKFSPPRGPALLIATSGSSGRPKAVVLTGAALAASAAASAKITSLRAGDRWLACLPLFHIGGFSILIRCALAGAEAMLHRGFDAERVHGALVEGRITHVSLTPTMLAQLLALQKPAPTGLRHALVGGAALPTELAHRAAEAGWPIQPTYGMSETCAQIATLPRLPPDWRTGKVGRPLEGAEIALTDDGRLKVRGPMLMHGYANPEFSPGDGLSDGWFVTNDLAEISPEGDLTILGRADETIVSGGKKIHPAAVEFLLAQCPGVQTVVVAGRPDPVWGEIVTAVFSGPASTEDLLNWCREHVASPFRPRAAVRLDASPLLANGKPDRLKLRELARRRQPEAGLIG
ncbi:AMP-binding protein [Rhodoblastus acidophilus]|uniref:AMP-binding protein n=1 Tax=Rhodoblastus acidophilus TaxID=1074 RepID=A0A6N8DJX8_RHOAC|nr:AMP-binding protein [Rhodoblastus acidophilus]MCW2274106.1 O-succinylbenzoic acid--CoA ligase [Rhodoblastus acidophilus]MTV30677.1 AMP-binding protein [Rhodoblastus acidophilus]